MKTLWLNLFILTCLFVSAQQGSPAKINYQASLRDASGFPVPNAAATLTLNVSQTATTNVIYSEQHIVTSNGSGLFSLRIGEGTVLSGSFNSIPWGSGPQFLELKASINGSTAVSMGAGQLVSVPYAFYADKTAPPAVSVNGNTLSVNGATAVLPSVPAVSPASVVVNSPHTVNNNTLTNTSVISITPPQISGSGIVSVSGAFPDYTVSAPQGALSLSGTTLSLTQGAATSSVSLASTVNTITAAGVASVNPLTGNNFTITVPTTSLAFNNSSGVLSYSPTTGTSTVDILPLMSFSGGTFALGPASNSISILQALSYGSGILSSGPASNSVNILPPLTFNSGTLSVGAPSNSLNILQTLSYAAGILSSGPISNSVNILPPLAFNNGTLSVGAPSNSLNILQTLSYAGGILASGPASNSVNILPTLTFNNGTLSVGALSNTVNIAPPPGPWSQPAAGVVALSNSGDDVGIGTNAPAARLHVLNSANPDGIFVASSSNSGAAIHAISSVAGTNPLALWVQDGHIRATGPAVTTNTSIVGPIAISAPVCTGCNDVRGTVSVNLMYTTGSAATMQITILFDKSYGTAPTVVLTPKTNLRGLGYRVSAVTVNSFALEVHTINGLAYPPTFSSSPFTFSYLVIE